MTPPGCAATCGIDSTNPGDGTGPGRAAAEYVMGQLQEVGLDPVLVESAPGRSSVLLRLEGADPVRPGLVVHGHLDVVPAAAADWSVDPGASRDGCLWGRGAVDMKDMDAMVLACVRDLAWSGRRPARPLTVVFFADEEAGGVFGSHWVVDNHPEWFAGRPRRSARWGYSVTVPRADGDAGPRIPHPDRGEGIAWLQLVARGRAGHGSLVNTENAVTRLAQALARIADHQWPREIIPSVRRLLVGLGELTGQRYDEADLDAAPGRPGPRGRLRRPDAAGHRQPDHAQRRVQSTMSSRRPRPLGWTPASCPARARAARHPA